MVDNRTKRTPTLMFDTSGLNAFLDDQASDALVQGIKAGYRVRLCGSSADELFATSGQTRRNKLLDLCCKLLAVGECTWPFNWIIEKQIASFDHSGDFDWKSLDVKSAGYEEEISRRERLTVEVVEQQRIALFEAKKQLAALFDSERPVIEAFFAPGVRRPQDFHQFLGMAQGTFWNFARGHYNRAGGKSQDDGALRRFVKACPPFQAMLLAIMMFLYGRCVKKENVPGSYRAGRLDVLMATYLPYCDILVTKDSKQEICLREIASEADIDASVLEYGRFRNVLVAP
jgi:hypothetical protein